MESCHLVAYVFFFSSRRRQTRWTGDWSSDVCSSDLGHHRHTHYIIANSEVFGFSPQQRAIVAAIARYLGKSRPEPMDRVMRMVSVEEHGHVASAVALLRLVAALNQDRANAPVKLR